MMMQPPQVHYMETIWEYEKNGKAWYFRFDDDDDKMSYEYVLSIPQLEKLEWDDLTHKPHILQKKIRKSGELTTS